MLFFIPISIYFVVGILLSARLDSLKVNNSQNMSALDFLSQESWKKKVGYWWQLGMVTLMVYFLLIAIFIY